MLGLACFMAYIRILKLMRLNKKIGLLGLVMNQLTQDWDGFMLAFGVLMIAHGLLFTILYFAYSESFKSVPASFQKVFLMMIGGTVYDELRDNARTVYTDILGKIFFLTFGLTVIMIVLNYMISILNISLEKGADLNQQNTKNYELVDFMFNKLSEYPGMKFMDSGDSTVTPTTDWLFRKSKLDTVTNQFESSFERLEEAVNECYLQGRIHEFN